MALISELIEWEKPDLVVVTGDLASGYAYNGEKDWFENLHDKFV